MSRACKENWELQAARYTRRVRDLNGGRDPHAWRRDPAERDPSWDEPSWTSGSRGDHDR